MVVILLCLLECICLRNGIIGLTLRDDALGFGLGMNFGFNFLVFVKFTEN